MRNPLIIGALALVCITVLSYTLRTPYEPVLGARVLQP